MASFSEMAGAIFYLLISTIVLIVATIAGGPIIDFFAVWISGQPAGRIPVTPLQGTFGLFYGLIIGIEIALFTNLFLTAIRRTRYTGAENEL